MSELTSEYGTERQDGAKGRRVGTSSFLEPLLTSSRIHPQSHLYAFVFMLVDSGNDDTYLSHLPSLFLWAEYVVT